MAPNSCLHSSWYVCSKLIVCCSLCSRTYHVGTVSLGDCLLDCFEEIMAPIPRLCGDCSWWRSTQIFKEVPTSVSAGERTAGQPGGCSSGSGSDTAPGFIPSASIFGFTLVSCVHQVHAVQPRLQLHAFKSGLPAVHLFAGLEAYNIRLTRYVVFMVGYTPYTRVYCVLFIVHCSINMDKEVALLVMA